MIVIALFFPAVLSLGLHCRLAGKKENGLIGSLFAYTAYLLVENLLCMLLVSLVFGQMGVVEDAFKSYPYFIKYISMNIVFSLIFPVMVYMVKKCVKVTVGVEVREEAK